MSLRDEKMAGSSVSVTSEGRIRRKILKDGDDVDVRKLIREYHTDRSLTDIQNAAHFLDCMAKAAPYRYFPPAIVLKAAKGQKTASKETNVEVIRFRARGSSIRQILGSRYGRGLDIDRKSGGMRASVNDADLAKTQAVGQAKRVRGAVASLRKTHEMIDPSKIHDPAVRRWVNNGVGSTLRAHAETDAALLLMPKPEDEKDKS